MEPRQKRGSMFLYANRISPQKHGLCTSCSESTQLVSCRMDDFDDDPPHPITTLQNQLSRIEKKLDKVEKTVQWTQVLAIGMFAGLATYFAQLQGWL